MVLALGHSAPFYCSQSRGSRSEVGLSLPREYRQELGHIGPAGRAAVVYEIVLYGENRVST